MQCRKETYLSLEEEEEVFFPGIMSTVKTGLDCMVWHMEYR